MIIPTLDFGGLKIKLGLASGSLNTVERGRPQLEMLEQAGIYFDGGKPWMQSTNIPWLQATWLRPQHMSEFLCTQLDCGIMGYDWALEQAVRGYDVSKITDFEFGGIRMVAAVPNEVEASSVVDLLQRESENDMLVRFVCVSEYPQIALEYCKIAIEKAGLTDFYGEPSIATSAGVYAKNSGKFLIKQPPGDAERLTANLWIEVTQTGESMKRNGLKQIAEVLTSTAGLYTQMPEATDGFRKSLIERLATDMLAVESADDTVLLWFNVGASAEKEVFKFLDDFELYAKAPTYTQRPGSDIATLGICVPATGAAVIRTGLERKGATDFLTQDVRSAELSKAPPYEEWLTIDRQYTLSVLEQAVDRSLHPEP